MMESTTDTFRTLPWDDAEFVVIDDRWRCVYTVDADSIRLVHLPGGRAVSIEQLKAEGHDVATPKRVRWWA